MIALILLRVGRPRMMLYVDGIPTTIKVTIRVLDLGSSTIVSDKAVVLRGEMESLVKPMRVETMGVRSFLVSPSFWKALRYSMSTELPVSTIILLM